MTAPTKTKPAAKPAESEEDGEKKGGKLKLIVIVLVALLAVGAGLYFFVFSGSGEEEVEEAPVAGVALALEPVTVNLAGGGYLKIGVTLQLTEDVGEEAPDGAEAVDIIIDTFSGAQVTDVTDNRDAMKAELAHLIEEAYNTEDLDHEVVMGIYYTQYVTQ